MIYVKWMQIPTVTSYELHVSNWGDPQSDTTGEDQDGSTDGVLSYYKADLPFDLPLYNCRQEFPKVQMLSY